MDGLPPLRPILSALKTPAYKLGNFFVPILSSITINEYTVKDSFHFSSEILAEGSSLFMRSVDVNSLFINSLLEKSIDICVNSLFQDADTFKGSNKNLFRQLLHLTTRELHFLFNETLYKQA